MFFFVIAVLLLIYLLTIIFRNKKLGGKTALILRTILYPGFLLLVALLVAEKYNVYPRSYWLLKGVFWLVVFSAMIAYGICRTELFGKFERAIYQIIFYLPLVFIPFLFIPFIGMAYGLLFYVKFVGDEKFVLYSDNNIRIEQPSIRFLGPDPEPIVYVKKNIYSFKDTTLGFGYNDLEDKVEVRQLNDTVYSITFFSPNNWQVPTGSKTIHYSLDDSRR